MFKLFCNDEILKGSYLLRLPGLAVQQNLTDLADGVWSELLLSASQKALLADSWCFTAYSEAQHAAGHWTRSGPPSGMLWSGCLGMQVSPSKCCNFPLSAKGAQASMLLHHWVHSRPNELHSQVME